MKRVLGLLVTLGIMFAAIGGLTTARAATTGQFTITVTVSFLEMSLRNTTNSADYATWTIVPQMALAASAPMPSVSGVYVNLGTTNADVDIKTYVSEQGVAWTVAATSGADKYSLVVSGTTTDTAPDWDPCISLTTSALAIVEDTSTAVSNFLYYKFYSPTSVGTGSGQTITVTVQIVAS